MNIYKCSCHTFTLKFKNKKETTDEVKTLHTVPACALETTLISFQNFTQVVDIAKGEFSPQSTKTALMQSFSQFSL